MEVMLKEKVELADEIYTGKVVRDGKVAVLVSPGYGAGWSTWNREFPEMVFDPAIVKMLEDDMTVDELVTYCTLKYPGTYLGGLSDLEIQWVSKGSLFRINEYDGNESLEYKENDDWMIA